MQDETKVEDILTLKQEAFCVFYTQNYETFGNATLSYSEAYGFDIDNEPDDDAIYLLKSGERVLQRDLKLLTEEQLRGKEQIEDSSRKKMYDKCSQMGSRLRRNVKIQARCRTLLNEFLREDVIDARLAEIALKGEDKDSIQAIREFNKLKQRIIDKKDITSGGKRIEGFNFIRAEEVTDEELDAAVATSGYADSRTPEEVEADSKVEVTVTTTKPMMCCDGLGEFGKCGRGTKTGCTGLHCRCMEPNCSNMHYVDCREHYIHIEHPQSLPEPAIIRNDNQNTPHNPADA